MCVYTQAFVCVCLCLYELWVCAFTLILNYFLLVVGGCSGALSALSQTQHEVRSTRDSGYDSGRQRLCSCWCKHLAPLAMHGANTPKKTDLQMHIQPNALSLDQTLSLSTECSLSLARSVISPPARALTHTVIFSRSCALSCSLSRCLISHLTISIVLSTNYSRERVSCCRHRAHRRRQHACGSIPTQTATTVMIRC
jgi:hypothetical protein